jgi:hypothetical protein
MARGGIGFALPIEQVTARALAEKNKGRKVTVADLAPTTARTAWPRSRFASAPPQ